jgi:hypothetical protein
MLCTAVLSSKWNMTLCGTSNFMILNLNLLILKQEIFSNISGSYSDKYEGDSLPGCCAMSSHTRPMFQRYILPASSRQPIHILCMLFQTVCIFYVIHSVSSLISIFLFLFILKKKKFSAAEYFSILMGQNWMLMQYFETFIDITSEPVNFDTSWQSECREFRIKIWSAQVLLICCSMLIINWIFFIHCLRKQERKLEC